MFNEKLRTLRETKGYTQSQLADMLHVSRSAVAKWEQSKGMPSKQSLSDIERIFNVSEDYLLKDGVENTPTPTYISTHSVPPYEPKPKVNMKKRIWIGVISFLSVVIIVCCAVFIPLKINNDNYNSYKKHFNTSVPSSILKEYHLEGLKEIEHTNEDSAYLSRASNNYYYTNPDSEESYINYVNYVYNFLATSPHISKLYYTIDRPVQADHQVSYKQYLFRGNKLSDFNTDDSAMLSYRFNFFTDLSISTGSKDQLIVNELSLDYIKEGTGFTMVYEDNTNESTGHKYQFIMSLRKAGTSDHELFSYYIGESYFTNTEVEITEENISDYLVTNNPLEISGDSKYFYYFLTPIYYFMRANVSLDITIKLKKQNESGDIEELTNTFHMKITYSNNWSTWHFIHTQDFGLPNNLSFRDIGFVSLELVDLKVTAPSYMNFATPLSE